MSQNQGQTTFFSKGETLARSPSWRGGEEKRGLSLISKSK
jgi:hypothetical protein